MNKTYLISEQENEDRKKMFKFDDSIKVLNVEDEQDLMDVLPNMAPPGNGFATDTQTLTNYLTSRGAKNVIIFDFSCSEFYSQLEDRDKRATRRMFQNAFDIKNASPPSTRKGVKRARTDTTSPRIKKQTKNKEEELFYKEYYRSRRKRPQSRRPHIRRSRSKTINTENAGGSRRKTHRLQRKV
jgi:hypothetical protein